MISNEVSVLDPGILIAGSLKLSNVVLMGFLA